MKTVLDCHCHTVASGHGYSTVHEYVKQAQEMGLELIAITDHAPNMPGSTHLFYFNNLKILPSELYGIKILKGAEVNIIDSRGNLDLDNEVLAELDIVIASLHPPCIGFGTTEENTRAVIKAMENPYVNIIGHPDDSRFPIDYEKVVKAAEENHIMLEVNNSSLKPTGFRVNAKENYIKLLEYSKRRGVPIIMGSDAHFLTHLGNFEYAEELIHSQNYPKELIVNDSVEKLNKFLKLKKDKEA